MILNLALLDTCFREGRQPQSVSERLPGWVRTKIIFSAHVLFMSETDKAVLRNSQKMRRIFEDKTAAFGASGAEAVAIG